MSVPYCSYSDINNLMDGPNMGAATNDYDSSAPLNVPMINNIILMASNQCDALVSSIYAVPFPITNIPVKIKEACIIFTCEALYARRLTPSDTNPFKERAEYWRKELMKVNSGELSLDAAFRRNVPPIVVSKFCSRFNDNFY